MPKNTTAKTGDLAAVSTIPAANCSNSDAFEQILDSLPARPDPASVALGRTLAEAVDLGAGAAMVQQYRELLAEITEHLPADPDMLDRFG